MGPDAGSGVAGSTEGGVAEATPPSDVTTTEDVPIAPVYAGAGTCGCKRCRPCSFYGAVRSCRGDR